MGRADVRFIRHTAALFNRGEIDALMDLYLPESEWVMPPQWPEDRTYRGKDRIRELVLVGPQGFDDYRFEEERLVALDDDRVLGLWTIRASVKGSGDPIESPLGAVYELRRDGPLRRRRLLRVTAFFSWSEAEAAAAAP